MLPRNQAICIWKAGIAAVDSQRLVQQQIQCCGETLRIAGQSVPLNHIRRIEVVGAGKAGAGMGRGVETAFADLPVSIQVSGWVNVPADCIPPPTSGAQRIHLHAARPAGINEPTAAAVEGTREILRRVSTLSKDDLCIVLISGGGSALLCCPAPGITLADKLSVTRMLSAAGAPIQDLNLVRTWLSQVKGGGLLQACSAGHVITLVISDVIGDPLATIASGPTIPRQSTAYQTLQLLGKYAGTSDAVPVSVIDHLESIDCSHSANAAAASADVFHAIIGNNQTAIDAAAAAARDAGFDVVCEGCDHAGEASDEGAAFLRRLQSLRHNLLRSRATRPVCVVNGGEPTVRLTPLPASESAVPSRKGGRNQEFVLGAIASQPDPAAWKDIVMLSGGTDGEDGPTDAAGAFADEQLALNCAAHDLDPDAFLRVNNSYPFFQQLNGLLVTGPTHTNVMDLRVALINVEPTSDSARV